MTTIEIYGCLHLLAVYTCVVFVKKLFILSHSPSVGLVGLFAFATAAKHRGQDATKLSTLLWSGIPFLMSLGIRLFEHFAFLVAET